MVWELGDLRERIMVPDPYAGFSNLVIKEEEGPDVKRHTGGS